MTIELGEIKIGGGNPFVLIAGPCVIENEQMALFTAGAIKEITKELGIPYIFKSSYRKANRTSASSFTGIGDTAALNVLHKVKTKTEVCITTDVHTPDEAWQAAGVADILQIPAFLCRQTELLQSACSTGKVVNIKKGQFLAPEEMIYAAEKTAVSGNHKIMFTERGSSFGYNNLVVDMRSLVIMKEFGYPVVMDATHSVQVPGQGGVTGGQPKFIKPIARAAAAVGIDALFLEVHPDPPHALSDAASQLPLDQLKDLLITVRDIDRMIKSL